MAQTGVEAAETNTVETSSGNGTAVDTATTSVAKPAATSEDAAAAGSPKKQILFNSPNKNASKTGIMKKKWRDGYYVPVGRAIVHRNSPLRAPYSTSLIQHSHSNDDRPDRAAKRINRDETVIFSRMIGCSSVSFSSPAVLKSKDIMTLNIEFHQIGSAGPAAYLPPKISFESSGFLDIAKYRKTVFPVLRPILILCGQGKQDEESLARLSRCLSESKAMALVELRTIESSACAASGTTTLFRHVDREVLAVFASDSPAKTDLGGKVVAREHYLLAMFVKSNED